MTKIALVTSFESGNLVRAFERVGSDLSVVGRCDFTSWMTSPSSEVPEALVVWTLPHQALASFRRVVEGERVDREELRTEVRSFVVALQERARGVPLVLLPRWVYPVSHRQGPLELRSDGIVGVLNEAQRTLDAELAGDARFVMLYTERWLYQSPSPWEDTRWYAAKIPFADAVFDGAVTDVRAAIAAIKGARAKVVAVDLDNTLWGGIIGDDGIEGVVLGGHDPQGEAFQDFQRALLALVRSGVLLAVVSKNDPATALAAIRTHPEMVLREEHIASYQISWGDKAESVARVARELNVGLDAIVFLDDSPLERGRVKEALPAVRVPEMPTSVFQRPRWLRSLTDFDTLVITEEDRQRAQGARQEAERRELQASAPTPEGWIASLEVSVAYEAVSEGNLTRVVQLLNKTNQFNLSTRRMTEEEFSGWARRPDVVAIAARVNDRFGEYGLTGLITAEVKGGHATVVDFVLSCRVFGRRIEHALVSRLGEILVTRGVHTLSLPLRPTEKNGPTADFLRELGWKNESEPLIVGLSGGGDR